MTLHFEDLSRVRRRRLFALLGTEWSATGTAWLCLPFFFSIGLLLAALSGEGTDAARLLSGSAVFGGLVLALTCVHSLGHTIGGRMAGSPGREVIVTATFHICRHRCDPVVCTRSGHLTRALGGPVANLLTGAVALAIIPWTDWSWLTFTGWASLLVAAFTLLPIPGLDGGAIRRAMKT